MQKILFALLLLAGCAAQDGAAPLGEKEGGLIRLANSTRAAGDTKAAEGLYRQVILQESNNTEAHVKLAELLVDQGKASDAIPILEAAQKLQPENTDVAREWGTALLAQEKPEEALAKFDLALAKSSDPRSYNGKGIALDMLGRHDEARRTYETGLKFDSRNSALKNNLALSRLFAGQPQEAIALLKPLLSTPDDNATMRHNLAIAYGLKGERSEAKKLSLPAYTKKEAAEQLNTLDYSARIKNKK